MHLTFKYAKCIFVHKDKVCPPWMVPKDTQQVARDAPCDLADFEIEHIKMCVETFLDARYPQVHSSGIVFL